MPPAPAPPGGAPLYVVLPGDVDDVEVPSGGNVYDRHVCDGLAALGWPVRRIAVSGSWPRPADAARARLAASLDGLPDDALVLLDGLVACGVPDVVVPRARRLRLIALVHLPLADETGLAPAVAADLDARERAVLRAVHGTVATSAWARHRVVDHHGLAEHGVHVVPPGADRAPLAAGTDGASALLCVASVTPRKGHDLLVRALASLADHAWSCTCVGPVNREPGYVARLRGLIDERGLADRVQLVGPRTGAELAAAYAAADLVVLPSRMETYGMVVTEALARGIPVLASAVGGVPEALGRTPTGELPGLLVLGGDAGAMSDALREWFTTASTRERVRAAARERRVTLEGWTGTATRMAGVLAAMAAAPAAPR